jgi:hypothetical protein
MDLTNGHLHDVLDDGEFPRHRVRLRIEQPRDNLREGSGLGEDGPGSLHITCRLVDEGVLGALGTRDVLTTGGLDQLRDLREAPS